MVLPDLIGKDDVRARHPNSTSELLHYAGPGPDPEPEPVPVQEL